MIESFTKELETLLNQHENARPFICEGNPLDCEVFVVGINAATEMENSFWSFWSNKNGFNKKEWFEYYIQERSLKPLKKNRTRRNKLSNTRQRIEWIVSSIMPIKTLETNLFVKATSTVTELRKEDRESQIFEFLVKVIKPKVIFIHGKVVMDYFESKYNVVLIKEKKNHIKLLGVETIVIPMNHLSRGWSKQKTIETGKLINEIVNNTSLNSFS